MMRGAALTSFGLHLAVLSALLAGAVWLPGGRPPRAPADRAAIELLSQTSLTGDSNKEVAPATEAPAPEAPAPEAPPVVSPIVPMPPDGLAVPMPPPAPAVPPALAVLPALAVPVPPPNPTEALDKAIGTAVATGIGVIPAAPDARRNLPPRYPEEAKRRGEEGKVLLVLHIAADGHVTSVDLERGSGSAALDRAAGDAVLHWHFHPALAGKAAVESTFETEVDFQFTDKKSFRQELIDGSH